MSEGDPTLSCCLTPDFVMKNNWCSSKFDQVNAEEVECLLNSPPDDTGSGSDNIDDF